VTGQNAARIVDSSGHHGTSHNQELAPTPLTVLGKYTVALPYVIARKTSGGLVAGRLRLLFISGEPRFIRWLAGRAGGIGRIVHRTSLAMEWDRDEIGAPASRMSTMLKYDLPDPRMSIAVSLRAALLRAVRAVLPPSGSDLALANVSGARVADREMPLLCVAYETLARRSELVTVEVRGIDFHPNGTGEALIRRGKTDTEGQGRVAYLSRETVRWLKVWLEHAKIGEGAIFRRLIGKDQLGGLLNPGALRRSSSGSRCNPCRSMSSYHIVLLSYNYGHRFFETSEFKLP
jgi:hypothetical protein